MLKTYFSLLAGLFMLGSIAARAQTITPVQYIESRIAKADSVQIDHIRGFFENDPTFRFECYLSGGYSSPEAKSIFKDILNETGKGELKITLKNSALGFDLILSKKQNEAKRDLFNGESTLGCSLESGDHCKALTYSDQKTFTVDTENKKDEPAIKDEAWSIVFKDGKLYARRSIQYTVNTYHYFFTSRKTGTVTHQNSQVCTLDRVAK